MMWTLKWLLKWYDIDFSQSEQSIYFDQSLFLRSESERKKNTSTLRALLHTLPVLVNACYAA